MTLRVAAVVIGCLFGQCAAPVQGQTWDVRWYAERWPDNPDYLKVAVDTHGLPSNALLRNVFFDITVFGSQTERKSYSFTNSQFPALSPGTVYVRFFPVEASSVRRVEPGRLSWSGGAAGGKADVASPSVAAGSPISDRDLRTLGEVPAVVRARPRVRGTVHLEGTGDVPLQDGVFAGTKGEHRRLEGFAIRIEPPIDGLGLRYTAHVQDVGDVTGTEGDFVGTRGQSRRLEGFAIELIGPAAPAYSISYMAHLEDTGDTRTFRDGEFCGTKGESRRVEGMQVSIEPRTTPNQVQRK